MKIGFIGIGNMGGAIYRGYSPAAAAQGNEMLAFDKDTEKLQQLVAECPTTICSSLEELVGASDVVVLGLKPNMYETILPEIAACWKEEKVLVSMAAGMSISFITAYLGEKAKIVRIMPNTPARVGCGMTAVSRNGNVEDEIFEQVMGIFKGIGLAEEIDESLMDCVIGVSGSSPAYTYMYIEALMNAAVKNGMEPQQAKIFAAQSVMGAAKMVLESEKTPEQLRIDVCSPGGTTIEAVDALLENGFRDDVSEGFQAAVEKSKVMTK